MERRLVVFLVLKTEDKQDKTVVLHKYQTLPVLRSSEQVVVLQEIVFSIPYLSNT